jgi:hypothetical protein
VEIASISCWGGEKKAKTFRVFVFGDIPDILYKNLADTKEAYGTKDSKTLFAACFSDTLDFALSWE